MILELCVVLVPQTFQVDEWFRLQPGANDADIVVSADRRAVSAETAIRELVRAMKWRIRATDAVTEKLSPVSLDLAITRRDPRIVAQWIAATARLEVSFSGDPGHIVINLSDARCESRIALQRRAIRWYEKVLADGATRAGGTARLEAWMGLGEALESVGELVRAATVYDRVYEEAEDPRFTARALLRASAVHLALAARRALPELKRNAHQQLAEQAARRALQLNPTERDLAAILQLGRVLARVGRWQDCIQVLVTFASQGAHEPPGAADPDIPLLLARALARSGQPGRAVQVLDELKRSSRSHWSRAHFLDYHYLRGESLAALTHEAGEAKLRRAGLDDAMRSLEIFASSGDEGDPRRSRVRVVLAGVYLETGRHLQARAVLGSVLAEKSMLIAGDLEAARALTARANAITAIPEPDDLVGREDNAVVDSSIRTMFHDHQFAEVIRRAGAIEEDDAASLSDMFCVGRSHEELWCQGKRGANEAKRRTEAAIPSGAHHRERANEIFARLERRDVCRGHRGEPLPGPWAIAAKRAREMMAWFAENEAWTPPPIHR